MRALHQNLLNISSAARPADDASEGVAIKDSFRCETRAKSSCKIGNQLRRRRINDVTGSDHRSAPSAARGGHENRSGLRDESLGERNRCLRSFRRSALARPANRSIRGSQFARHFDQPAQ